MNGGSVLTAFGPVFALCCSRESTLPNTDHNRPAHSGTPSHKSCKMPPGSMGGLAPSAGSLERTPGAALRTSLLHNRDVRGAPHPASSWCAHGVKVPAVLTPQWYPHVFAGTVFVAKFGGTAVVSPRFCSRLLCGGIPTVLHSTSSWPSLVAPQWYPGVFAVSFFVAEFVGPAVVSSRLCGQHLHGRVWWHRSGIPPRLCSQFLRGRVW